MDTFAALIAKKKREEFEKRKRVDAKRKFIRRGEIQRIEDDDYERSSRKRPKHRDSDADDVPATNGRGPPGDREHVEEKRISSSSHADGSNCSTTRDIVLTVSQVKRRLRAHGEPATLFGETDRERQDRLLEFEKNQVGRLNDEDLALREAHRGRNVFLKHKHQQNGSDLDVSDEDVDANEDRRARTASSSSKSSSTRKRSKEMICYKFFKTLLRQWSDLLACRPDEIKGSVKGKIATKTQKQCKDYMRPFFKMCKKRTLPPTILEKVHGIVELCTQREYVKAHSIYMDLAIGRAAWPIGATSVGIHERAARERIHVNNIAHVMNDEAARKYVTSIKRLMTFCQTQYPTDPSKMVLS